MSHRTLSAAVPLPRPGADSTALRNKCEQNLIFCWINLNCKSIVNFFIVFQGASVLARIQVTYKFWCWAWHRWQSLLGLQGWMDCKYSKLGNSFCGQSLPTLLHHDYGDRYPREADCNLKNVKWQKPEFWDVLGDTNPFIPWLPMAPKPGNNSWLVFSNAYMWSVCLERGENINFLRLTWVMLLQLLTCKTWGQTLPCESAIFNITVWHE